MEAPKRLKSRGLCVDGDEQYFLTFQLYFTCTCDYDLENENIIYILHIIFIYIYNLYNW